MERVVWSADNDVSTQEYVELHTGDGYRPSITRSSKRKPTETLKDRSTDRSQSVVYMGTPGTKSEPVETELTDLQSRRLKTCNLYVTDALNTRPPNNVLKDANPRTLMAYQLSHNSLWSTFVYLAIWIHLFLIFFEPYANVNITTHPKWLYAAEFIILGIYSINQYLTYISHDEGNYWKQIHIKIILWCIVINTLEVLSFVSSNSVCILSSSHNYSIGVSV